MKKEKYLISIMVIIFILIISLTAILLFSNTILKNRNTIIGKWVVQKNEAYEGSDMVGFRDDYNNKSYIIVTEKKITACYFDYEHEECDTGEYDYDNGILVVKENSSFISGKYEVTIENNSLLLKQNLNENGLHEIFYFSKDMNK